MQTILAVLIILGLARVADEGMERLRLPGVVGELLLGLALGVAALNLPWDWLQVLDIADDRGVDILLDVAIFALMFLGGLDVDVRGLARALPIGAPVALGGVVLPLALGVLVGWRFVPASDVRVAQVVFLGVALSITAVPVTLRVLLDLGQMRTRLGSAIIDAAVIDDVLGIALLGFLTALIKSGEPPSASFHLLQAGALVAFFGVSFVLGRYVVPAVFRRIHAARAEWTHLSTALLFAVGMGMFAEVLGMHFVIGAFVAGAMKPDWAVEDKEPFQRVEHSVRGVTLGFLAPVFFVTLGMSIDLSAFQQALGFTFALLGAAIVGKLSGCAVPARLAGLSWRESLAVGIGMNGRGAVELVVASVALQAGLFSLPTPTPPVVSAMFSAVVLVALITTVLAPLGLRLVLAKQPAEGGAG